MNEPALVELRNVCKRYPGVVALDDVTLTLRAGTVTALAGENGAGDTHGPPAAFSLTANAGLETLAGGPDSGADHGVNTEATL